jgi:hypothetical protein
MGLWCAISYVHARHLLLSSDDACTSTARGHSLRVPTARSTRLRRIRNHAARKDAIHLLPESQTVPLAPQAGQIAYVTGLLFGVADVGHWLGLVILRNGVNHAVAFPI